MIFEEHEIQKAKELTERCHKFADMDSTMSKVCPNMDDYGICHCNFNTRSCKEITEHDWLIQIGKTFIMDLEYEEF